MSRSVLSRQRPPKITYFKKDFKLMIHNITLQEEVRSTFYTLQCANYTSIPKAIFNISINQTVDITTIDITSNQEQKADLEVTLDLSHFAKGIKNDLALVKFMVNKQKILAPSSVNFYTQPLANRKGTIQYKFVGQKTTEIYQDQVQRFNLRRDQVVKIEAQLAQNPQLKRLVDILDSKDQIIKTLQRKIASLIQETRKLSNNLQRQHSQQKKKLRQGLNLNLNINATNNFHMKKLNEKLTEENTYLHKRIETIEEEMQQTQKKMMEIKLENNILQIQLGKRDILDPPFVTVTHPSRTTIVDQSSRRDQLHRITQQEYDQELLTKSKMADSLFMANNQNPNIMTGTFGADDFSIKSRIVGNSSRRPHNTMIMDKSAANLMLNSTISPRALRQRSKSLVDPQFANIQQQMQQSRMYDQEQVMMELNELKDLRQNLQQRKLQSIPQQDGSLRYPKLQAAIKSSYRMIERLNDEKILLQQKVRRRDQQVEYLRRQLQKSKMNFKNFQKQLRQRSSNAKDQFEQRMAAIKMQTEMKMAEMRKQNRFSDYEFVMQQQKRQIQLQKMRYQNQSLRQRYEQAMSELRSLQAEKSTEVNKFKTTQTALNKEKQMYKSKFYQMQDSFTKQQQELSITKQKAKQYDVHLVRIEQLQQTQQDLRKKLQANQKANNELIKKCKRYQDKFAQIEPKWTVYRQMENEFDVMKRKNINLQKLNERFETRMEEMKKFALKLQNAYYEKKSKNQPDKQFDQAYQKQIEQRLQQTYKKLRLYQKQFYQEQQQQLNQTKKQLIEFYYKKIVQENQRIDQAINYNQQQRQMFKNQKQHEINIIKESKLEEIDKQIKKYQIALNKLLASEDYMPKGLNEKVTYLEEKVRKFEVGEFGVGTISQSSQCQLKNTIDRLNDSIKDRESQINELKKTIGKMSDGGSLLKVSNIEATFANQRKSMIEEMAKSRQIFSRSFEDLKRANAQLLKQKSALQIELQNYKFREQKLILKNTERERQLERVSKKSTDDFKRKVSDLQKQLQKKSDESLKHKLQKQEFKQNMNNLIGQLNATATLLQKREQDNLNLQAQNEQLKSRIEQYEQAQKALLEQVKKIKSQAEFNEKEFKCLLQQRNESFLKIEKIKNVEIEKLQKTIQEMEMKVETQITEVLHAKRDLEKLQEQYNTIQSQLEETKVSYSIVNENYNKVQEESVLKIHELQQTNDLLERNLMQLAEHLKDTEMQLHQTHIMKESLSKQLQAMNKMKGDITVQQTQWMEKQKRYTLLIQQQTQKLTQLSTKYNQISSEVASVQKQNQQLQYKMIQKQSQLQQIRQKLNKKYDEVNTVKGEKFQSQMLIKQLNVDLQDMEHQRQQLTAKISQLEEEINQLNQDLVNANKNVRGDGLLSMSRVDASMLSKSKVDGSVLSKSKVGDNNMGKSKQMPKLKPPPKTNLLSSSNLTHQQMQYSKMSKSSKIITNNNFPSTNQLEKSKVSAKKIPSQDNRGNIYIDEAVSLRGTEIKNTLDSNTGRSHVEEENPKDSLQIQQLGPNRMRIWTVNENIEDERLSRSKNVSKKNMDSSQINVDVFQESEQISEEDPNLDSEMSMREQQKYPTLSNKEIMINTRGIKRLESVQMPQEQLFTRYPQQQECESLTSNAMVEQYLKEIQNLKLQNQKIFDEKQELVLENAQLKQKISVLTGNVQQSQRKNLLASALGLTGGIFAKQSLGQRGSVESNQQNPGIPTLNIKSQKSVISPQMGSKHTIRLQESKQMRGSMISKSKHSISDSPGRSPKESRNLGSGVNFARSSVERPKSSRRQSLQNHLDTQQEKIRELELLVDQLEEENKGLKGALEEQHGNNERLMQQIVLIQQQQQEIQKRVREKQQQTNQVTNYYESIKTQLQKKIQQLVQQQISKQTQELKLVRTFEEKNQQVSMLTKKIEQLQKVLVKMNSQIKQLQRQKQLSYVQYRKYQQQSELQILKLKQQLAENKQILTKKQQQLQLLAQDYFQLQSTCQQIQQTLKQRQSTIDLKHSQYQQLQSMYNQLLQQTKKYQEQRKTHNSRIHQLQTDIISHQNTVETINKATTMTIKKYQINLQTSQQEKQHLREKLTQKETIIQSLKHQIALYNQQTLNLQQLNRQLSLQLQRTQKQLKDIMKSYEQQFSNLQLDLKSTQQSSQKYKQLLKQKDQQLSKLNRLYRRSQQQTRQAHDLEHQTKQLFEKYKSSKTQQINNLMNQIEINHNQYQKLKTLHEKYTLQFNNKQSDLNKKITILQQTKLSYKQKLIKYQNVLQELENQLNVLSQRPTKEVFDQMQFENDLYKNRIEELQQMIAQFGPINNKSQKNKNSQQTMQVQFKRYKLQKQRQLDDLQNQIDKYSLKINQLQQGNFMLKKQIQKLKQQIKLLVQKNQTLQQQNYDLKEDITQLKEETEFYKGKRIQNLSKLLNQTM